MPTSSLGVAGAGLLTHNTVVLNIPSNKTVILHILPTTGRKRFLPSPLLQPCLDKEPNTTHRITDLFNPILSKTSILINEPNGPPLLSTHLSFSQLNISGHFDHSLYIMLLAPSSTILLWKAIPSLFDNILLICDTEKG